MASQAAPLSASPASGIFSVRKLDSVPPDSGIHCSLALDAALNPLISCWRDLETTNAKLLLIRGANDPALPGSIAFTAEQAPTGRGTGSALAIDQSGRPWVAYYDLDADAVQVARRESTGWVVEPVESGISNFAAAGIGMAIGSDGQPRVAYSSSQGLAFATRSAVTSGWQRDVLAGAHWQRDVITGGRLKQGFDMGRSSSNGRTDFSQQDDSFKIVYPGDPSFGVVFVTFGQVAPLAARAGTDVTAYSSLLVEMRGDAGKQIDIGIKDKQQPDLGLETKVRVTLNSDWTTYLIPLNKFVNAKLDQIYFMAECVFSGSQPITAFLRSVQYTDIVAPDVIVNRVESAPSPTPQRRDFLTGASLAAGFDLAVGSSGGSNNFATADGNSIRMAYPPGQSFGFVTVHPVGPNKPGLDLSAFSTLVIELRGDPGKVVQIGIKDRNQPDDGSEKKVAVKLTSDWRTYSFPLSLFSINNQQPDLRQLFVVAEIVFAGAQAVTAFVRSVRYLAAPAAVIARPANAASLGGTAAVHSSLSLGPGDVPHVSYFDLDAQKFRVAWRAEQFQVGATGDPVRTAQWQVIEIPDPPGDRFAGEFTSIKVDGTGVVHTAWWSLTGPRYARIEGPLPAAVESIESATGAAGAAFNAGLHISVDVDRQGQPRVAYYDSGNARLRLARKLNGQWAPETVDANGNVGGFASLALDRLGSAHVAYYDFDARSLRIAAQEPAIVAHVSLALVQGGLRGPIITVQVESGFPALIEVLLEKQSGAGFVPATSDPLPLLSNPILPANPAALGTGPFRVSFRVKGSSFVLGFSEVFAFPPPKIPVAGTNVPQDVILKGSLKNFDSSLAP